MKIQAPPYDDMCVKCDSEDWECIHKETLFSESNKSMLYVYKCVDCDHTEDVEINLDELEADKDTNR